MVQNGEGNNDITPVDQAGVRILSAKMKNSGHYMVILESQL